MSKLVRFSISIDENLVKEFDKRIRFEKCLNRSKAISMLINRYLVERKAVEGEDVAGAIGLVYDHHKRMIGDKLTSVQHDYHKIIVSTQHIHLTHSTCFEIIIVRGNGKKIEELYYKLKKIKGLLNSYLTLASSQ